MASTSSPDRIMPIGPCLYEPTDPTENPGRMGHGYGYTLRLDDRSLDLNTLTTFPWKDRSYVVITVSPHYDSPDPKKPHMVDFENREAYMKFIVDCTKATAAVLKPVLEGLINAGEFIVEVHFGDC